MKLYFVIFFSLLAGAVEAQEKYSLTQFNKLTEVKGTPFVIASFDSKTKISALSPTYLLFIDTSTGEANQVDFPEGGSILQMEQVKIDSLAINKIIVAAKTVDADGKYGINWDDPSQIFVLSADGQNKQQLTDNNFFVRDWAVNKTSGTITVTGFRDVNANNKFDKGEKSQILIYDLKSLKIKASL